MSKAIFCDIDGTILEYHKGLSDIVRGMDTWAHAGAAAKLCEWHKAGYMIILTTKRPESMREVTVYALKENGILYDQILFGIPTERHLINDYSDGQETAFVHNVDRSIGIRDLEI